MRVLPSYFLGKLQTRNPVRGPWNLEGVLSEAEDFLHNPIVRPVLPFRTVTKVAILRLRASSQSGFCYVTRLVKSEFILIRDKGSGSDYFLVTNAQDSSGLKPRLSI
jgi:hypothetical protein